MRKKTAPSPISRKARLNSMAAWPLAALLIALPLQHAAFAQSQPAQPDQLEQQIPVGVGILNATDYQPIPAGSGFDTVVQDPSNPDTSSLDAAILERVNQELVERGYHVDHEAQMVMLIDGDLVRGTSKDAVVDKIKGITPPEKQGNVFSTNGDTLLTRTIPDNHPNTFRINLSIYDRTTGLYLWRGSMERGTSDLTPDKATDHVGPPLVATIGKAAQNRNIAIGTTDQPQ